MFTQLLDNIKHEVIRILARVQVKAEEDVEAVEEQRRTEAPMQFKHEQSTSTGVGGGAEPEGEVQQPVEPFVREGRKVGRNEPCPCGSGQKYKHCHGKLT